MSRYFLHGGLHCTRTLELIIHQRSALCNLLFGGWHCMKLFAVPPRDRHRYYVQVAPSSRELETYYMLCVPTLPMFASFSGASRNGGQSFCQLLLRTAFTESMVISPICLIRAAEFDVADLS